MHLDTWLRRLANGGDEPRSRLEEALARLIPDAPSVFATLDGESTLLEAGILAEPMATLEARWTNEANAMLSRLGFSFGELGQKSGGRDRSVPSEAFKWLWGEFTAVYRSEPGATW
jgi:1,2-phenylacetyl-CoA epoxidase catalytic subunit